MYRRTDTGQPISVSRAGNELRVENLPRLTARSGTHFTAANGLTVDFSADGMRITDAFGTVDAYARVPTSELAAKPLAEYAGAYDSNEAETTMIAAVESDVLVLKRRPDTVIRLTPLYADAFRGSIGFIRFHRDAGGKVTSFSITQDRVWDMRFQRSRSVGSRQSAVGSFSRASQSRGPSCRLLLGSSHLALSVFYLVGDAPSSLLLRGIEET